MAGPRMGSITVATLALVATPIALGQRDVPGDTEPRLEPVPIEILDAPAPLSAETAPVAGDPCAFEFASGFSFPGGFTIGNGRQIIAVRDMHTFDDGSGPILALAGDFLILGGTPGSSVQFWDGHEYLPTTRTGNPNQAFASRLVTYDDGSGPMLYGIGGAAAFRDHNNEFVGLARWDGTSWQTGWILGSPMEIGGKPVLEDGMLGVLDLGDGPRLFVAGRTFDVEVASYDGVRWEPLSRSGELSGGTYMDFEVFDRGAGPELYLAGSMDFRAATGQVTNERVMVLSGGRWHPLSKGFNGSSIVVDLHVFDDGTGPKLLATSETEGVFERIGDGWVRIDELSDSAFLVSRMLTWDDGTGPALYIAGQFRDPADPIRQGVVLRWQAGTKTVLGTHALTTVVARPLGRTLAVFDDGRGEAIYVGGSFNFLGADAFDESFAPPNAFGGVRQIGGVNARSVARWDGSWEVLGGGLITSAIDSINIALINRMIVHDDGSGPALYAGGDVAIAGGVSDGVIRRSSGRWERVGRPLNGVATALASGLARPAPGDCPGAAIRPLYAAASVQPAPFSRQRQEQVLQWDGQDWTTLGADAFNASVTALAETRGGGPAGPQPLLIAGGSFTGLGTTPARRLAVWDGARWQEFEGGSNGPVLTLLALDSLAVDPASVGLPGPLIVGGVFGELGGVPVRNIGVWDGFDWRPLGAGVGRDVRALAIFDDGSGPLLYAGGTILANFSFPSGGIAYWDGLDWQGVPISTDREIGPILELQVVDSLLAYDSPSGPALAVGGSTGRLRSGSTILSWSGSAWEPFGVAAPLHLVNFFCGICTVPAVSQFDEGDGDAIWVAGTFLVADARPLVEIPNGGRSPRGASALTKWVQAGVPTIATQPRPISSAAGAPATFSISALDPGNDEALTYEWRRNGVPLRDDRPILEGVHTPTLRFGSLHALDEAEYSCLVSNSCGSHVSRPVTLEVCGSATCLGDADRSGQVDAWDLVTVLIRWGDGQGTGGERFWAITGDASGDGRVDFDDVTAALAHWMQICP